ncbi:MAG: ATP-binding protein [Candidatus Aminicenantaceae bacterium]
MSACSVRPYLSEANAPPHLLIEGWETRWGDSPFDAEGIPAWTYQDLQSPEWTPVSRIITLAPPNAERFHWLRIGLPEDYWSEPVLFFPRVYLHLQVYLEDRLLYSYGEMTPDHANRLDSFVSHRIFLPPEYQGQTLFIRMFTDLPSINGIEGSVFLGARESLLPHLIQYGLGDFTIGVFCIIIGFLVLLTCLDRKNRKPYAALSFGTFALFGGLAYLSRTYALTWIVHAPVFWYYAMFASYFLFPAALVAFAEQIIGPGYKNFIRRLWQFHLIALPLMMALDISGILIIPSLMWPFRFLWALDTITLLVAGLLAAIKGKYEARIMLLGIGVFSLLSLHDMFGAPTGVWLMPAGTFVFIILMGHLLYHRFTENSRRLVTYSQELEEKSHRLEEAKSELEEYSRTLEHKVEERTRELREKQAQLVQSSKMASLGSLVAGVAHEINTPVGAISSMHNTLTRAVEKLKAEIESCLDKTKDEQAGIISALQVVDDANRVIASGTDRVIDIVKRLRSFARLDEAELKDADINEGLEDTLAIIHHEIKHNIIVHRNYGDIPKISCFPGRLNQVFLNIFINAKQAIKEKGEVSITTSARDNRVFVEIKDSGEGIPREKLDRIFDPGYTTKGVGVGTGLGLAICYQIIEDHRGEIKVESVPGKGTTFTVILPTDLEKQLEASGPE